MCTCARARVYNAMGLNIWTSGLNSNERNTGTIIYQFARVWNQPTPRASGSPH